METLESKRTRIEQAVADLMEAGLASEADIWHVLYAMHLAGYDFVKNNPF